ncbi:MAG: cadmium-translocating P-type ATPase, partial [Clostridia bacterium]|nr:cadmium-translocating P-type ATPase [Clostridia bacterium]
MKKKDIVLFVIGFILMIPAFIESLPLWIRLVCAGAVYVYFGFDVFRDMIEEFKEGEIFNEGFLMCAATIGAIAIGEYAEAAAVMILFSLGEALGDAAFDRSMESLEKLIDLTPEYAYIMKGDRKVKTSPENIEIGDTVLVSAGERIPIDGIVADGGAYADYSSVTGEPEPVALSAGDKIISGGVVTEGSVSFKADRKYSDSTAAKLKAAMDEAAEKKAPHERFVAGFARIYTPAAIALAALVAVIGIIVTGDVYGSVKSGLVIMVVSCPCALVISIPLTYCAAMGRANRHGFIFKGGESIERASDIGTVVFDKTGTLTEGDPDVSAIVPQGSAEAEFINIAYSVMKNSLHPLSKKFCESVKPGEYLHSENAKEYPGRGVSAIIDGKTALAGNARLLAENGIEADKHSGTAVYVAYGGRYIGRVEYEDKLKAGAKELIPALKKAGVGRLAIMSGDSAGSVAKTAKEIGIDEYYAGLLPDEKLSKFEEICTAGTGSGTAYCGDGLNDSAVILRSDAGFAMGGNGSGIAASIEAADIVIG